MLTDPAWLAAAIATADNDRPELPEDGTPNAEIDVEFWSQALTAEHYGDCNGQPQTCMRCAAEWYRAMADWIITKAEE